MAEVGTTTVSRVINGGRNVNRSTLARVQKAIKTLGYVPSQAARTLKGERTKTVGLVIPSINDPFFSSCAKAIDAVAHDHDSLVLVTTTNDDPDTVITGINFMVRHSADGVIVVPAKTENGALSDLLSRLPMPIVLMDRPVKGFEAISVVASNFEGARLATKHLIEHGCKRILCLTGETMLYTLSERIRGYQQVVKSAKYPCMIETSAKNYETTKRALKRAFSGSNPPDAIFTLKNSTTIYAYQALQRLNISMPRPVALLGYDDFDLAEMLSPPISVIQQPIEKIGQTSAEILFKQIQGWNSSDPHFLRQHAKQTVLDVKLIRRRSCGCQV